MGHRHDDIVIDARGIRKSFPGRGAVLDGIDLQVRSGESVVIMGGSGCGKSTLLKILVGILDPDEGEVSVLGCDIIHCSQADLDEVRKRIGILFQSGALYNSMTVGENVALPLLEHSRLNPNIVNIIVKMKLELVGLRDFERLMPSQISGGMRKRVGLARAIALDPEILFYDEPGAGLDPVLSGVIDQLIIDLSHKLGVTSIVVSHDMMSAFKVADRIMMLHGGRFVAVGTPDEIRSSPDPLVQQFIAGAPDGPIPLRRSTKTYAADLLGE